MLADGIVAILAGLAQLVTAILGYRVSARPIPPEDKRRHKIYETTFWIMGIIGALTIVYNGITLSRTLGEIGRSQSKIQTSIGEIAKSTSQPPLVVNAPKLLPPVTPLSRGFLQLEPQLLQPRFVANQPLSINLYFTNKGQEPIANTYHYGAVRLAEAKESPITVHSELLKVAKNEYRKELQGHIPGTGLGVGQSIWNGPLGITNITQDQYAGLKAGSLRLYVFGWAHWKNAANDLDECVWLKIPDDDDLSQPSKLVWRDCIQPSLPPH